MKSSFLPLPLRSLVATVACAFLTASSFAQAPAPGAPTAPAATPAPKPLSASEKNFLKNAAKSAFYQMEIAKAGKTGITDEGQARVRDGIVRDLTRVLNGSNTLAAARGEKMAPGELTGADKADVERLAKLKDEKFVKQWVELLLKESKKLDREFEAAERSAQDVDFKTFLANYGPSVRSVFSSVEKLDKALAQKKK